MSKPPAAAKQSTVDYRLLVPLLINSAAVQIVVSIARVTTSYRVLELALPVIWLGVISATFAILPVFLAIWVGRFMDRGNDARVVWLGSALVALGCAGLLASISSLALLLASTAVVGTGHLFLMASQQLLCTRCSDARDRESVFGNYMVAAAVGQGLGPYIVGWLGGSATVPPTQYLFRIALIGALATLAAAIAIRPDAKPPRKGGAEPLVPVRELLRVPGLAAVLSASVITTTAMDLTVVYLPLLGAERSIDVSDIGRLLTVRAASSMVSRLLYSRLLGIVGRIPLMVSGMIAAGIGYALLAAPVALAVMYFATTVIGFALGIATTLTITSVVVLTTAGTRGTAGSLRIMGNRIGQVVVPFGASVVASVTGSAGIFLIVAAALAVSGAAVHWSRPDR